MAAIARLPWIARLEAWLAQLPPWAALIAFVAPSTLVLPVKLAAVWFALQGKLGLATLSIVVGKMVATALVARLYTGAAADAVASLLVSQGGDLAVHLARSHLRASSAPCRSGKPPSRWPAGEGVAWNIGVARRLTLGFSHDRGHPPESSPRRPHGGP